MTTEDKIVRVAVPGKAPLRRDRFGRILDADNYVCEENGVRVLGMGPVPPEPPPPLGYVPPQVDAGGYPVPPAQAAPPAPPARRVGKGPLTADAHGRWYDRDGEPCGPDGYILPVPHPPLPPMPSPAAQVAPQGPPPRRRGQAPWHWDDLDRLYDCNNNSCSPDGYILDEPHPPIPPKRGQRNGSQGNASGPRPGVGPLRYDEHGRIYDANGDSCGPDGYLLPAPHPPLPPKPVQTAMVTTPAQPVQDPMMAQMMAQNKELQGMLLKFALEGRGGNNQAPAQNTDPFSGLQTAVAVVQQLQDVMGGGSSGKAEGTSSSSASSNALGVPEVVQYGGWNSIVEVMPDGTRKLNSNLLDTWLHNTEPIGALLSSAFEHVKKGFSLYTDSVKEQNNALRERVELLKQAEKLSQSGEEAAAIARQRARLQQDLAVKESQESNFGSIFSHLTGGAHEEPLASRSDPSVTRPAEPSRAPNPVHAPAQGTTRRVDSPPVATAGRRPAPPARSPAPPVSATHASVSTTVASPRPPAPAPPVAARPPPAHVPDQAPSHTPPPAPSHAAPSLAAVAAQAPAPVVSSSDAPAGEDIVVDDSAGDVFVDAVDDTDFVIE